MPLRSPQQSKSATSLPKKIIVIILATSLALALGYVVRTLFFVSLGSLLFFALDNSEAYNTTDKIPLGGNYFQDKDNATIYYKRNQSMAILTSKDYFFDQIDDADAFTFVFIRNELAQDKNGLYCKGERLIAAPFTFKLLGEPYSLVNDFLIDEASCMLEDEQVNAS